MSRKCHRCGVQALEGQTFAFERYPFLGERTYCPGCHRRFLTRLEILSFGFWMIVAVVAAIRSQQRGGSPLDPLPVQFTLLLGFAWLVTFPHELGHALAARWAGFRTVRVLIGWGRPLANFRLFGATWMIGCVPFGGLTLPGEPAAPPSRRSLLVIAGAGLIVNGLLATAAWLAVHGDLLTGWMRAFGWLFFWSNVWVIVVNAVPRKATTPYGAVQLDGLLLWNLLFHQGKPLAHESAFLRRAQRTLLTAFKAITLLLLGLAVVTFGALIWFLLVVAERPTSLPARVLLGAFFLILMVLSVTMMRRVFRAGLPSAAALPSLHVRGATELVESSGWQRATQGMVPLQRALDTGDATAATRLEEALKAFPQDPLLLALRGGQRFNDGDFVGAEADFAAALRSAPEVNGDLHAMLLAGLLQTVTHQHALDRVEERLNEYLQSSTQRRNQIEVLDHLICDLLYRGLAAASPHAERWARRALELAPGTPTLLGTLGGVLAEHQGREAEAEPLLQRCLQESVQLHDQAVAALFLGVLAVRRGDRNAAMRLLKRATSLPSQAWLQARADRELAELAKGPS